MSILLIGNAERAEFQEAVEAILRAGVVVRAADPDVGAASVAHEQLAPDLIVVAVAYPGQFSAGAIDGLRRQAPLAPIVALLGSSCEGEMRSGHPWPGVVRVYAHQWLPRFGDELAHLRKGGGTWSLPVTATDEERLLSASEQVRPQRQGLVAVHTSQSAMADFLLAACRSRCYAAVRWEPANPPQLEGAVAVLFDATDFGPAEEASLRRLVEWRRTERQGIGCQGENGAVPIIVLLDFPRTADRDRARRAGAAAVLSKPLLLDDLWWQLDEVMRDAE